MSSLQRNVAFILALNAAAWIAVLVCPLHLGDLLGVIDHPSGSRGFDQGMRANVRKWQTSQIETALSYQDCPKTYTTPPGRPYNMSEFVGGVTLQRKSPRRGHGDPILACMIYSYHGNRQKAMDIVQAWARYCDHLFVFSDELFFFSSDADQAVSFMSIEVYPIKFWRTRWDSTWPENMWGKLWSMWGWMNKTVCHPPSKAASNCISFDFLLVNGDDTFIVMENLRAYLASPSIMKSQQDGKALYVGRAYLGYALGAGYVLNRVAFDVMLRCDQQIFDRVTWNEDEMTGMCMRRGGVPLIDNAAEFGCWGLKIETRNWHDRPPPTGPAAVFHYAEGERLFQLHSALYSTRRNGSEPRNCMTEAWRPFDFVFRSGSHYFTLELCGVMNLMWVLMHWRLIKDKILDPRMPRATFRRDHRETYVIPWSDETGPIGRADAA